METEQTNQAVKGNTEEQKDLENVETKKTRIFSKKEIKQAKSTNLIAYIKEHGHGYLDSEGSKYPKYIVDGHDTVVINAVKNYFYHNGGVEGGDIIKFMEYFEGLSFHEAVGKLLNENLDHVVVKEAKREPFKWFYKPDKDTTIVRNYLQGVRGIDSDIVDYLIDKELVYQHPKGHCIFPWRDTGKEKGTIVGSNLQGTVIDYKEFGKRGTYKHITENVTPGWGFNISLGRPDKLYFFESVVDLLSYWSLNKNLNNARLVSMEGISRAVVDQLFQDTATRFDTWPTGGIYYGVDNDFVGHTFVDKNRIYGGSPDGEIIESHSIIPYDNEISHAHFDLYQEVANDKNVEWEVLAAFHKVENNLTETDRVANGFKYGMYFADPTVAKKHKPISIKDSLNRLADTINEVGASSDRTLTKVIEAKEIKKTNFTGATIKINKYIKQYKEKNYELVHDYSKDYNEKLKSERSEGLETERYKLSASKNKDKNELGAAEQKEAFKYYLNNNTNTDAAEHYLINMCKFDSSIVQTLIKKGMIREDVNNRVAYVWGDRGIVVGGQIQGTDFDKKRFGKAGSEKKVMDGSEEIAGFNVSLGNPKVLYVFSTPEELLGFWTLYRNELKGCKLQSLPKYDGDVAMELIDYNLKTGLSINEVHFCGTRDKEGMEFLDQVSQNESYDVASKCIITRKGEKIPVRSNMPKLASKWSDELLVKRERMDKVMAFNKTYNQKQKQFGQQHTPQRQSQAQQM